MIGIDKSSMSRERKKMMPPTILLLSIAAIAVLHFLFPLSRIIPFPWNLLGIIPLVMGVAINIIADGLFKKLNTTIKPFEESSVLVTTGVFRFSRHPMYLGMLLILLGIAVLTGSLTPYAVAIVFVIIMELVFIRAEEKMLEKTFDEAWKKYKQTARRWI